MRVDELAAFDDRDGCGGNAALLHDAGGDLIDAGFAALGRWCRRSGRGGQDEKDKNGRRKALLI